jgi:hypothetical protein
LRRFQSSAVAACGVVHHASDAGTPRSSALEEVLSAVDHHGDALATAQAHIRNAQLHVAARHLVALVGPDVRSFFEHGAVEALHLAAGLRSKV